MRLSLFTKIKGQLGSTVLIPSEHYLKRDITIALQKYCNWVLNNFLYKRGLRRLSNHCPYIRTFHLPGNFWSTSWKQINRFIVHTWYSKTDAIVYLVFCLKSISISHNMSIICSVTRMLAICNYIIYFHLCRLTNLAPYLQGRRHIFCSERLPVYCEGFTLFT